MAQTKNNSKEESNFQLITEPSHEIKVNTPTIESDRTHFYPKLAGSNWTSYLTKSTIIIGRSGIDGKKNPDIDFGNATKAVSRKHCIIRFSERRDRWELFIHSRNGVLVNRVMKLPKNRPIVLETGTLIEINHTSFVFVIPSGALRPTEEPSIAKIPYKEIKSPVIAQLTKDSEPTRDSQLTKDSEPTRDSQLTKDSESTNDLLQSTKDSQLIKECEPTKESISTEDSPLIAEPQGTSALQLTGELSLTDNSQATGEQDITRDSQFVKYSLLTGESQKTEEFRSANESQSTKEPRLVLSPNKTNTPNTDEEALLDIGLENDIIRSFEKRETMSTAEIVENLKTIYGRNCIEKNTVTRLLVLSQRFCQAPTYVNMCCEDFKGIRWLLVPQAAPLLTNSSKSFDDDDDIPSTPSNSITQTETKFSFKGMPLEHIYSIWTECSPEMENHKRPRENDKEDIYKRVRTTII